MDEKEKIQIEQDDARENQYMKKIEAALFISGRWLSMQELVMLTDLNPILLRQVMEKLIENYTKDERAIKILYKDDKWKMDVEEEYVEMINKLATGNSEFTRAEQETLAIIAYKQPIKQSVIVKIRGNKAYEHIRKFSELGFVKGRRLGHTKELSLSESFHDYFKTKN